MDADSNKDDTAMLSTSDVLSVICFVFTAYYILRIFQPSQDAPMPEPSPGPSRTAEREILRTSDISSVEQFENAEIRREIPENFEMRGNEWVNSFGVEGGRTDIISPLESEESGAGDLSGEEEEDEGGRGDEDWNEEKDQEDEDEEEEDEEETKPRSSKERGRFRTAYNAPTNLAPPKKQREIKQARKPTAALLIYRDGHYVPYNPMTQNQGTAVLGPFRHFSQYDGYALYINPHLKETELEQIPHSGVRVDDLTASKVLLHYSQRTLHNRWRADFDHRGMIRAIRVPLGRAAKRWVKSGERDVKGERVEKEGWYYLSWGGIHTLMGKEGLDVKRYRIRPSHDKFKCDGLGFKISDWAEIQLAPEDPEDPTFL